MVTVDELWVSSVKTFEQEKAMWLYQWLEEMSLRILNARVGPMGVCGSL